LSLYIEYVKDVEESKIIHNNLGKYFLMKADPKGNKTYTGTTTLPFMVVSYHFCKFGDFDTVENLLTDLDFILKKYAISFNSMAELAKDFEFALLSASNVNVRLQKLELLISLLIDQHDPSYFGVNKNLIFPWEIIPSDCIGGNNRHRGTSVLYWNNIEKAWYTFDRKFFTGNIPMLINIWAQKPATSAYIVDLIRLVDSKTFTEMQKQRGPRKLVPNSTQIITSIAQKNEFWGLPMANYHCAVGSDYNVMSSTQICMDAWAFRPPMPEIYFKIRKLRSFNYLSRFIRNPFY